MRRLTLILFVVLAAAVPSTAFAAPGVVQDLPGCTTELEPNDDGSTDAAVALGFDAEMFDTSFNSVFVNNNGNVTVGDPLGEFTPFDFRESGQAMIAPFFADVDTRGTGTVTYGQTTYGGQPAFCVTWDDVGYFSSHTDKVNRFQLIIVDQADGVDLVFNYDAITWETGDASGGDNGFGGTSAVAGYAAGDGDSAHALMLPGSFVNGGLLDGNAAASLAGHGTTGQPAGRYIFQLRQSAASGARLTGTISDPSDDPVSGALVQICRDGGGGCITRVASGAGVYVASNLAPGSYTVTAYPGPDQAFGSARVENVTLGGAGTTTTQDLQLTELAPPPPDGTTITSIDTTDEGLPVAYWDDPLQLVTHACPGATTAEYTVVVAGHIAAHGTLAESPAGTYHATIPALHPNLGDGLVRIEIDCPTPQGDELLEFGIYIDPSGVVRDKAGRPVAGATVVLLRSAAAAGPFFPVPDGSAVMSPGNRVNPDTTGADGRFGWDVVAGYYIVTASKAGCVSAANPSQTTARSAVLTIPPPVTNLDLRLDCGSPTKPPTSTSGGGHTVPPPATLPRTLAKVGKVKLRKRALLVPVACAPTAKLACAGKVTVKLAGKVIARKTYSKLKPGKTAKLKVALSKQGRKRIAKIKKGKKFKLVVTATVKDAAGNGVTAKRIVTLRR